MRVPGDPPAATQRRLDAPGLFRERRGLHRDPVAPAGPDERHPCSHRVGAARADTGAGGSEGRDATGPGARPGAVPAGARENSGLTDPSALDRLCRKTMTPSTESVATAAGAIARASGQERRARRTQYDD